MGWGGGGGCLVWAEWSGYEADYLQLCQKRQKFMELYLHSAYIFMTLFLVRHRGNFTLNSTMCRVKSFDLATLVTPYSLLFSILVYDGRNLQRAEKANIPP
jgi:hypothetical protein